MVLFFQKLQEKLDNNGGSEDHNHHQLFVPSLDGHHADSGRLPSLLSNNNSTSHFDENLVKNHSDGASRDSQHLPTDTIVLVGSLIVMIFIGKQLFILSQKIEYAILRTIWRALKY